MSTKFVFVHVCKCACVISETSKIFETSTRGGHLPSVCVCACVYACVSFQGEMIVL